MKIHPALQHTITVAVTSLLTSLGIVQFQAPSQPQYVFQGMSDAFHQCVKDKDLQREEKNREREAKLNLVVKLESCRRECPRK